MDRTKGGEGRRKQGLEEKRTRSRSKTRMLRVTGELEG